MGLLPQQPLVGGDVRLTFRGVDQNGVHLPQSGGQLGVGGEGGVSHAHHPGLPDEINEVLSAQPVQIPAGPNLWGTGL